MLNFIGIKIIPPVRHTRMFCMAEQTNMEGLIFVIATRHASYHCTTLVRSRT